MAKAWFPKFRGAKAEQAQRRGVRLGGPTSSEEASWNVRDAHGRVLDVGDELIAPDMKVQAPRLKVTGIRPNLNPNAPPGTVILECMIPFAIVVPKNAPTNLFLTRKQQEIDAEHAAAEAETKGD